MRNEELLKSSYNQRGHIPLAVLAITVPAIVVAILGTVIASSVCLRRGHLLLAPLQYTNRPAATTGQTQPSFSPALSTSSLPSQPTTLAVQPLPISYSIHRPQPSYQRAITVSIPKLYVNAVTAYSAAEMVIIAPKAWTGEGVVSADGSANVTLHPIGESESSGPAITVTTFPSCYVCAVAGAAPYFDQARQLVESQHYSSAAAPAGLVRNFVTSQLVRYSLPATRDGLERNGVAYIGSDNSQPGPPFLRMEVALSATQRGLSNVLLDVFTDTAIPLRPRVTR